MMKCYANAKHTVYFVDILYDCMLRKNGHFERCQEQSHKIDEEL